MHQLSQGLSLITLSGGLICLAMVSGCSPTQSQGSPSSVQSTSLPNTSSPSYTPTAAVTETPAPSATPDWKVYTNSAFGLSIQYPSSWYGPDVYEWEQGVSIQVGSDYVYPWRTNLEDRVYEVPNSYYISFEYRRNSNNWSEADYRANSPWAETYWALLSLKDGETLSDIRESDTRLRMIRIGRFEGLEYIATLSETAQTEWLYARLVVLFDEHLNVLMITGTPNNVQVVDRARWKEAYHLVDEANVETFQRMLELLEIE